MADGYYDIAQDDELVEIWDRFERLPERGENPALDAFCERKNITIESLVALGARLKDSTVLAFAYPGGIKYRDVVTDKRWNFEMSEFAKLKMVYAGVDRAPVVIVAEGETDAARLRILYPQADVAVLPAGANPGKHVAAYAEQLNHYELVLLGQDYGVAGDKGAAALADHLTTKWQRWLAPIDPVDNSGWGDVPLSAETPTLPDPAAVQDSRPSSFVTTRELLAMESPELKSYFEQAILPVTGQLILHGAKKSFKSYLAFDMAAALAQGEPWCGFESESEPVRVGVMQFEIPFGYYQERVDAIYRHARHPELLDENLIHWEPKNRPRFVAGNLKDEDYVLKELERARVEVFLLDPIRRATGAVDLNSEDGVRPMLHFFQRCQDNGITVITTHHDNKQGERSRGGDSTEMTGSGAFGGDADSIVSVALPRGYEIQDPDRNLHFLLRNAPSPSARSMRMGDTGAIDYAQHPVGEHDEDTQPTPGSDRPSI